MAQRYTWQDKPQPCPVCSKIKIDPDITEEMMEVACSPYGYIQCPEHFPEPELNELKEFLSSLECVRTSREQSGPVQDVPVSARARVMGLAILLPLPWAFDRSLPEKIMEEVEKWAQERGWERFGMVVLADCPLLLIGLRKPRSRTTLSV